MHNSNLIKHSSTFLMVCSLIFLFRYYQQTYHKRKFFILGNFFLRMLIMVMAVEFLISLVSGFPLNVIPNKEILLILLFFNFISCNILLINKLTKFHLYLWSKF